MVMVETSPHQLTPAGQRTMVASGSRATDPADFGDHGMTGSASIVERDDVRVMFRRSAHEQEAITRTWAEVEAAVGSLRGRKFYGVFDPDAKEYRVCVQWQEGD